LIVGGQDIWKKILETRRSTEK